MKRINAQKSGNWSDISVWGGVLPTQEDMVYCNSFTIILDQDIKVKSISNDRTYSDIFGGELIFLNENTIIEADLYSNYMPLINIYNKNLTIKGNIYAGYAYPNTPCIISGGNGRVEIVGSVTGGGASNCAGIFNNSTETLNITGSVCCGAGEGSYAICNEGEGKVIINNNETTERYIGDYCQEQTPIII